MSREKEEHMKEDVLLTLKETDTYFLKLIQDVVKNLNEIDELIETNAIRQSKTDSKISDYEHIIESEELSDENSVLIIKKLKEERQYRRHQKNEYELINAYNQNKAKLSSKENRQFLTAEIYKVWTRLNQKYNMRVLDEKEVEFLTFKPSETIENSKKETKRRRGLKSLELDDKIWGMYEKGLTQSQMSKELSLSQPTISCRLKRLKQEKSSK